MDTVATTIAFGATVLTAWYLFTLRTRRSDHRASRMALGDLLEMDPPEGEPEQPRSRGQGRYRKRCACAEYVLPYSTGSVRDNDALHSRHRCQPNREVIDAV